MPAKLSKLRKLSRIGTWLSLRFFALEVGRDAFGNRYFRSRFTKEGQRERRFVFYPEAPEASSVPAPWYLWLHHTARQPLPENSPFHQKWEKEHQINPTGTDAAWLPPGHTLKLQGRKDGSSKIWSPYQRSEL